VYNDSLIDKLFIKLFTQKMADQLEGEIDRRLAAVGMQILCQAEGVPE
jgi:hypothetical protein